MSEKPKHEQLVAIVTTADALLAQMREAGVSDILVNEAESLRKALDYERRRAVFWWEEGKIPYYGG